MRPSHEKKFPYTTRTAHPGPQPHHSLRFRKQQQVTALNAFYNSTMPGQLLNTSNFTENLIQHRLDPALFTDETHDICSICQDHLLSTDEHGDQIDILSLPTCAHIFHGPCIIGSMHSTTINRNRCPMCRMVMCQLSVLSPERETERAEDLLKQHHGPEALFNTTAYVFLMRATDNEFDQQYGHWRHRGTEDYMRILPTVRAAWLWATSKNLVVCQDHADGGKDWLELAVASRVKRHLEDRQVDSKAGYLFMKHEAALDGYYRPAHPRFWEENEYEASDASDNGSTSEYSGGNDGQSPAIEGEPMLSPESEHNDGPGEQGSVIEDEPMLTPYEIAERDFEMRMIQEQLAFGEDEDGDIDMGAEGERVRSHRLTPPPQPPQPPIDGLMTLANAAAVVERLPPYADIPSPVVPTHTPGRAPRVKIPHRPVRAPRVEVSRSDTDSLASSAIHSVRSSRTRRDRSPPPESSESDSDSESVLESVAAATP
jgi:hypothetical protein